MDRIYHLDGVSPMADLRRKNGREKPWKLKYLGIGNENWGCGGSMRLSITVMNTEDIRAFARISAAMSFTKLPADQIPTIITGRTL